MVWLWKYYSMARIDYETLDSAAYHINTVAHHPVSYTEQIRKSDTNEKCAERTRRFKDQAESVKLSVRSLSAGEHGLEADQVKLYNDFSW